MTKHEKVAEFPGNSHEINTIKQVGIGGVFEKKHKKCYIRVILHYIDVV